MPTPIVYTVQTWRRKGLQNKTLSAIIPPFEQLFERCSIGRGASRVIN